MQPIEGSNQNEAEPQEQRDGEDEKGVSLTAEMLLSFSDLFLKKNFDQPVSTPHAHLEWWAYCCLPRRYVALAAPRGHAKSTAITHTFVLASICLRIKKHVLLISDTEGQASMFLGNISRELRENEDLRRAFGFKKFIKDNETELIIQWQDGGRTRLAAHGAGQKIRGTNWHGVRPDLIICDDLENDEAVMNEERRIKFRNWFLNTLLPIGNRGMADIRVVGTILHEDSLLARLMPNQIEDPECVVEPLKVTTKKKRAWLGVLYRAHPDFDDFSVLLWPEGWTEETLRERQLAYIDDGFPEGYAQEYLNNPMAAEGAYFQEEDLLPILPEEMFRATMSPETFYIGVDLAISEESKRAFTVFMVAGVDPEGTIRIREVVRKRMDGYDIMDMFFHLHAKYKAKAAMHEEPIFLVEKENIAKALGSIFYKTMEETGDYFIFEPMPPIKDKLMRGRSIQARIRAHRVEFPHEASWWPTLKHEMITFPRSTYKDQVDALAWIGHYLAEMSGAPTWQDIADAAYYDDLEEAQEEWGGGGVNRITGY